MYFTGRPASLAAMTVRITCGWVKAFEPKPPPTYGAITRTRSGGRPNALATSSRIPCEPWLLSWRVTPSSFQAARVACISSGLLW